MADYTGKDLYMTWVHSGGTAVLSSDFRTVSHNPTVSLANVTAGGDTDATYIARIKDATIDIGLLMQSGGTVLKAALCEGTGGTLIISPEGTASGKAYESFPAISLGAKMSYPYAEAVEVSCSFQKNGARAEATYA